MNGRSPMAKDEVEAIAQALYGTQECARGWAREPEVTKERFRNAARAAVEVIDEHREITTGDIAPLVLTGDIRHAREFLMNSPEVSVLSIPRSELSGLFYAVRISALMRPVNPFSGLSVAEGLTGCLSGLPFRS
jgi:hypothetical protein